MPDGLTHAEAYMYWDPDFEIAARSLCETHHISANKRHKALRGPLITCLWCMARL